MAEQDVISNQRTIIDNQKAILGNQQQLKDNQVSILANQQQIQDNQKVLQQILKNQEKILSLLAK